MLVRRRSETLSRSPSALRSRRAEKRSNSIASCCAPGALRRPVDVHRTPSGAGRGPRRARRSARAAASAAKRSRRRMSCRRRAWRARSVASPPAVLQRTGAVARTARSPRRATRSLVGALAAVWYSSAHVRSRLRRHRRPGRAAAGDRRGEDRARVRARASSCASAAWSASRGPGRHLRHPVRRADVQDRPAHDHARRARRRT